MKKTNLNTEQIQELKEILALVKTAIKMTSGHQTVAASDMGDILLDIHTLLAPLINNTKGQP